MRKALVATLVISALGLSGCGMISNKIAQIAQQTSTVETTTAKTATLAAPTTTSSESDSIFDDNDVIKDTGGEGITDKWISDNFLKKQGTSSYALVNPEIYVPKDLQGVPLPGKVDDNVVVWQAVGCTSVPFTAFGPEVATAKDGVITASGWISEPVGAVVAGWTLMAIAYGSQDRAAAIADATGLSKSDAQKLLTDHPALTSQTPSYRDTQPENCYLDEIRSTAFQIVDYGTDWAEVDYFVPIDSETGVWTRAKMYWDAQLSDWRLEPESFTNYQNLLDGLAAGNSNLIVSTPKADETDEAYVW